MLRTQGCVRSSPSVALRAESCPFFSRRLFHADRNYNVGNHKLLALSWLSRSGAIGWKGRPSHPWSGPTTKTWPRYVGPSRSTPGRQSGHCSSVGSPYPPPADWVQRTRSLMRCHASSWWTSRPGSRGNPSPHLHRRSGRLAGRGTCAGGSAVFHLA